MEATTTNTAAASSGPQDVLVGRALSPVAVRAGLCQVLGLTPDEVLVVERLEQLPERDGPAAAAKAVCHVTALAGGQFPRLLAPWGPALASVPWRGFVADLCRAFRCECLVGDDSVNPFTFWLVDAAGNWEAASVDPDRVDAGEYVVVRRAERPRSDGQPLPGGSVEFHDGYLVGHGLEPDGSIDLCIRLDNVWNNGSSRIVHIRLSGISDMAEAIRYFAPVQLGPSGGDAPAGGTCWREAEPTVLGFEMLELDGKVLVSLDLLGWGELDVICDRVESNERSAFRFVT